MTLVLLAIFRDKELSRLLAFKGGTSLLMFHGLPRFSTDLDFNLLEPSEAENMFHRLKALLAKFGTIDDSAMKYYGPVLVLNYGKGERMLKVELSCRQYDDHYETINLLGTDIRVMTMPDMFAHKLCALGERVTPRDVFDVWFFLHNRTEVNANIIRLRTGLPLDKSLPEFARQVHEVSPKALKQGLGEVLLDVYSKNFVKKQLVEETVTGLELFAVCPLVANQKPTPLFELLEAHPEIVQRLMECDVDISMVCGSDLKRLLDDHEMLELANRKGEKVKIEFQ